jgi:hypothetical protein
LKLISLEGCSDFLLVMLIVNETHSTGTMSIATLPSLSSLSIPTHSCEYAPRDDGETRRPPKQTINSIDFPGSNVFIKPR